MWLDAGPLAGIPLRGARVLRTPQGPVALFRTSSDRVEADSRLRAQQA
jgi:nitrite reductase (NADH) small subunit